MAFLKVFKIVKLNSHFFKRNQYDFLTIFFNSSCLLSKLWLFCFTWTSIQDFWPSILPSKLVYKHQSFCAYLPMWPSMINDCIITLHSLYD